MYMGAVSSVTRSVAAGARIIVTLINVLKTAWRKNRCGRHLQRGGGASAMVIRNVRCLYLMIHAAF